MDANSITPNSLLTASTQHAYGYDPVGSYAAANSGDLRSEVKDAECNIRHDIGQAECGINTNILTTSGDVRREVTQTTGDLKFQLHDNIVVAERNLNNRFGIVDAQLVRNEMQTKLSAEQVIKEVTTEARRVAERIEDQLDTINLRFTDKVCDVERRTGEQFVTLGKALAECCCKIEGLAAGASQTGLVNAIVSALNVKNGN